MELVKQTIKITLAWELFEQEVPKIRIAEHLEVHQRTIHRWIAGIKENGGDLESFTETLFLKPVNLGK